VPENVKKSFF